MLTEMNKFAKDRSGITGVFMGIAAFPVLGVVGIALDHGLAAGSVTDAGQIIEEACARTNSIYMASAPLADRVAAAEQVVDRRLRDAVGLDSVTFTTAGVSNHVEVGASGMVDTAFLGLIGMDEIQIDIHSICGGNAAHSAGVCARAFDPGTKRALHVHESIVSASGCEIHVVSDDREAAVVHNNSSMTVRRLCVAGNIVNGPFLTPDLSAPPEEFAAAGAGTITGLGQELCLTAVDPFAALTIPLAGGCDYVDHVASGSGIGGRLRPGRYCGDLTIEAGARGRMDPGVYHLDGALIVEPAAHLTGTDVVFVVNGNSDIVIEGATVELTAPILGALAGQAIFQPISGSKIKTEFTKGAQISIDGNIYLPLSELKIEASVVNPPVGGSLTLNAKKIDVKNSQVSLAAPF